MCTESKPAKNFSATQGTSAGASSMEKSRPSVIHLRLLSSLAPSGAALSLLLAFLPRSPPLRMVRCGEWTSDIYVPPVKAYGIFALPPHPMPGSSEAQVIYMNPDLLICCNSVLYPLHLYPVRDHILGEGSGQDTEAMGGKITVLFLVTTVPWHARQSMRFPFSLA